MSAIEELLAKKDNVIYLIDNITSVVKMDNPDFNKIKMHLNLLTKENIYKDKIIPIFTEDAEARFLLKTMFNYFSDNKQGFSFCRCLYWSG